MAGQTGSGKAEPKGSTRRRARHEPLGELGGVRERGAGQSACNASRAGAAVSAAGNPGSKKTTMFEAAEAERVRRRERPRSSARGEGIPSAQTVIDS